jgi:uncharacterized protein (TIGR03083 family)
MTSNVPPHLLGPWPDGRALSRRELTAYVDDVADGSLDDRPTQCAPWSVRDVTAHLAATFQRFQLMLDQGRAGDFTPPFSPDELDTENLRAVEVFDGQPLEALVAATNGFLDDVTDLDEPVPHQLATIPAGLQVLFGLMDITIHHDDVLCATGRRYRPQPETIDAVVSVAERLFGMPPAQDDPWALIIHGSGRPPV